MTRLTLPPGPGLHRFTLRDGRHVIVKRRMDMPAAFFAAEAHGLHLLGEAGGLPVPQVIELGRRHLVIEDLGSARPKPEFAQLAGHGLARQHAQTSATFGLDHDGWCGDTPQDNTLDDDGHRFFAQRRLLPQAQRAHARGRLAARDLDRVEHLCARLPELLPSQPAVLLHGDLWSGNLHCDANGCPALIDAAAVHYGWAEAELAMLSLFSEPPPGLLEAYAEAAPLAPDWRQRAALYNLYHLLNHLNLFGGGYLPAVREVLSRYA